MTSPKGPRSEWELGLVASLVSVSSNCSCNQSNRSVRAEQEIGIIVASIPSDFHGIQEMRPSAYALLQETLRRLLCFKI